MVGGDEAAATASKEHRAGYGHSRGKHERGAGRRELSTGRTQQLLTLTEQPSCFVHAFLFLMVVSSTRSAQLGQLNSVCSTRSAQLGQLVRSAQLGQLNSVSSTRPAQLGQLNSASSTFYPLILSFLFPAERGQQNPCKWGTRAEIR